MSEAEHRKPCESRGSCTVLGARGGEIPPRDSPIVLQKSAAPRPIAKTGNIRIRRVEFLNQDSLFGLDLEKVFFAPWAQNRFATLSTRRRHRALRFKNDGEAVN